MSAEIKTNLRVSAVDYATNHLEACNYPGRVICDAFKAGAGWAHQMNREETMTEGRERFMTIEDRNSELEAQNALLRGFIAGICTFSEIQLTSAQCAILGLKNLVPMSKREDKES